MKTLGNNTLKPNRGVTLTDDIHVNGTINVGAVNINGNEINEVINGVSFVTDADTSNTLIYNGLTCFKAYGSSFSVNYTSEAGIASLELSDDTGAVFYKGEKGKGLVLDPLKANGKLKLQVVEVHGNYVLFNAESTPTTPSVINMKVTNITTPTVFQNIKIYVKKPEVTNTSVYTATKTDERINELTPKLQPGVSGDYYEVMAQAQATPNSLTIGNINASRSIQSTQNVGYNWAPYLPPTAANNQFIYPIERGFGEPFFNVFDIDTNAFFTVTMPNRTSGPIIKVGKSFFMDGRNNKVYKCTLENSTDKLTSESVFTSESLPSTMEFVGCGSVGLFTMNGKLYTFQHDPGDRKGLIYEVSEDLTTATLKLNSQDMTFNSMESTYWLFIIPLGDYIYFINFYKVFQIKRVSSDFSKVETILNDTIAGGNIEYYNPGVEFALSLPSPSGGDELILFKSDGSYTTVNNETLSYCYSKLGDIYVLNTDKSETWKTSTDGINFTAGDISGITLSRYTYTHIYEGICYGITTSGLFRLYSQDIPARLYFFINDKNGSISTYSIPETTKTVMNEPKGRSITTDNSLMTNMREKINNMNSRFTSFEI